MRPPIALPPSGTWKGRAVNRQPTNHQSRIDRLEEEASITAILGQLAGSAATRLTNLERSERIQGLADEQKRRDTGNENGRGEKP